MAAKDYLQMKLFMTPTELMETAHSPDEMMGMSYSGHDVQSMQDLWDIKLQESKVQQGTEKDYDGRLSRTPDGWGIYDSLEKGGWKQGGKVTVQQTPKVTVQQTPDGVDPDDDAVLTNIWDGHHRIAAAKDIEERSGGSRSFFIPIDYRR